MCDKIPPRIATIELKITEAADHKLIGQFVKIQKRQIKPKQEKVVTFYVGTIPCACEVKVTVMEWKKDMEIPIALPIVQWTSTTKFTKTTKTRSASRTKATSLNAMISPAKSSSTKTLTSTVAARTTSQSTTAAPPTTSITTKPSSTTTGKLTTSNLSTTGKPTTATTTALKPSTTSTAKPTTTTNAKSTTALIGATASTLVTSTTASAPAPTTTAAGTGSCLCLGSQLANKVLGGGLCCLAGSYPSLSSAIQAATNNSCSGSCAGITMDNTGQFTVRMAATTSDLSGWNSYLFSGGSNCDCDRMF